jgi:transposase
MSEQSSGPERPVRETPRSDQQWLFSPSAVPPGEGEESSDTGERRFVEKNPQEITVGGMPLGRYLKERDQEWILVIRERLRAVDWSSWEARYDGGGRPPYHPAPMVGLVIYGVMDGKGSLRELEELAVTDLGCMWLTGGIQPDHATIGRFICRHDEQFKEDGFLELTESILEVMPHVDREVAGDGTILEAFASEMSKLEDEAAEQWAEQMLDKSDEADEEEPPSRGGGGGDADGPTDRQRARQLLEHIAARRQERSYHGGNDGQTNFSRTEPDAVWHRYKEGGYGFGYVSSIVTNGQRLIVGQAVDRTSEKDVLEEMLDQAETLLEAATDGEEGRSAIERVALDNNYFTLDILEEMVDRQLDALIYPDICEADQEADELPKRGGKFAKEAFEYDADRDVYICPAGEQLPKATSGSDRHGRAYDSYGRSPVCQGCPLREECTESQRGRTVKRYAKDRYKDAMREVMAQPKAREAYSRRMGSVEPVFGEIQDRGGGRARRAGLDGAAVEMALNCLGHNFDRLRTFLTSGRLQVSNLGTQTASYTEPPGAEGLGGGILGLQTPDQRLTGRRYGFSGLPQAVTGQFADATVPSLTRGQRLSPPGALPVVR